MSFENTVERHWAPDAPGAILRRIDAILVDLGKGFSTRYISENIRSLSSMFIEMCCVHATSKVSSSKGRSKAFACW